MHVVCDILTHRVAHELVFVAIQLLLITDKVIAHHTRTRLSVLFDKTMHCSPAGVVYHLGTDLIRFAFLDANDCGFTHQWHIGSCAACTRPSFG